MSNPLTIFTQNVATITGKLHEICTVEDKTVSLPAKMSLIFKKLWWMKEGYECGWREMKI